MTGYGWTKRDRVPWDKISATGPAPVDPGIYLGEITEAKPRETKNNDPSMQLILDLVEDAEGEAVAKKRVYDNATFTETGGFRVKQLCEALDLEPPEYNGYADVKEFGQELLGKKVWCKVKVETYNGNTNNKIDRYFAEDEVDAAVAEMAGSGEGASDEEEEEKPQRRAKKRSKSANGASANGASGKRRRGAAAAAEAESEDMTDEASNDYGEEEEASAPTRKKTRRRSRANA